MFIFYILMQTGPNNLGTPHWGHIDSLGLQKIAKSFCVYSFHFKLDHISKLRSCFYIRLKGLFKHFGTAVVLNDSFFPMFKGF